MVERKQADKEWDVVIVGSGFAGALIANALGKAHKQVLILEAGAGVPPNINEYMDAVLFGLGQGAGKSLYARDFRRPRRPAERSEQT